MSDHLHTHTGQENSSHEEHGLEGSSLMPPAFSLTAGGTAENPAGNNGNNSQLVSNPVQAMFSPAAQGLNTMTAPPFQLKSSGEEESQDLAPAQFTKGPEGDSEGGDEKGGGGAKGIVMDITKSKAKDFAWQYWDQLVEQYAMELNVAELLERAALYLIDYGVRVTGIGAYLAAMNPYLEILKVVKDIIDAIPAAIKAMLGYFIGYGILKFSTKFFNGAIKEKHINFLLIEGGDFASKLADLIEFLYDLGHNPVRTIYKGIWAAWRAVTGDDSDSFVDLLLDDKKKERQKQGTLGGGSQGGESGETQGAESEEMNGVEAAQQDNLFNADLGFFWMRLGQPKLQRWNEEDENGESQERGGIEMDGGIGVKLFGNAMGSNDIDFKLPYAADWTMTFNDISVLSEPIHLGNWFRGGPVNIPKMIIKSGVGLDYMHLQLLEFAFGQDVFVAHELGMIYTSADSMLNFYGDTQFNFFGHTLLGRFALNVGTDGAFKGGNVEITLPESLELIKNRLSIGNLGFTGIWNEEGVELLELAGDVHLNLLDKINFDATRAAIRWEDGQFKGLLNELAVVIPLGSDSFVKLVVSNAMISGDGFDAQKIQLIFSYGDQEAPENQKEEGQGGSDKEDAPQIGKDELSSVIPGLNLDWMKTAGLETLVVSASANSVHLGGDGFSMDGDLEKKLHKFGAKLLGVTAKFDGDKNEGSLEGAYDAKVPKLPSIGFDFPIIPGINAGVGIDADLSFGAELHGTLQQLAHQKEGNITPWEIGGYAGVHAHAGVRAHFDVSLGSPLLVSIHAGLFAEAGADFNTDMALHGVVNWNDESNSLALSKKKGQTPSAEFDLSAVLHAELGAEIRAKAFHIFNIKLWEYKFLDWEMGLWRAKGRLFAKDDGTYGFEFDQTGFDKGKPERKPQIEYKAANSVDVINDRASRGDKIGDSRLFWRLVHDVTDTTSTISEAQRMILLQKLGRLNDTGEKMDDVAGSARDSMAGRLDEDSASYSLLMTRNEFEMYSRESGWFGEKSRKHIKGIDEALEKYHNERNNGRKRQILIDLIDSRIPTYLHEEDDRTDQVVKLLEDAKRELKRVEALGV